MEPVGTPNGSTANARRKKIADAKMTRHSTNRRVLVGPTRTRTVFSFGLGGSRFSDGVAGIGSGWSTGNGSAAGTILGTSDAVVESATAAGIGWISGCAVIGSACSTTTGSTFEYLAESSALAGALANETSEELASFNHPTRALPRTPPAVFPPGPLASFVSFRQLASPTVFFCA